MINFSIGLLLFTASPVMAQLKAPGPANNVTYTAKDSFAPWITESALPRGRTLLGLSGVCAHEDGYKTPCYMHTHGQLRQSGNDLAVALLLPRLSPAKGRRPGCPNSLSAEIEHCGNTKRPAAKNL